MRSAAHLKQQQQQERDCQLLAWRNTRMNINALHAAGAPSCRRPSWTPPQRAARQQQEQKKNGWKNGGGQRVPPFAKWPCTPMNDHGCGTRRLSVNTLSLPSVQCASPLASLSHSGISLERNDAVLLNFWCHRTRVTQGFIPESSINFR